MSSSSTIQLKIVSEENSCGECTACCTQLPISAGIVSEAKKEAGEPCPHLCSGGCSVYDSRPQSCQSFMCSWLRDKSWDNQWRPDVVGLLCIEEALSATCAGAAIYELWDQAFESYAAQQIIERVKSRSDLVVLITFQGVRHTVSMDYSLEPKKAASS